MLDGVFHQGRQHHGRKGFGQNFGRRRDRKLQTRAHTHLQDIEVRPNQFQFLPDSGRVFAHFWQRGAQIGNQVSYHLVGGLRIHFGQGLHVGQGVVQEVGLDLRLQRLQPRFSDLSAHVADFSFLRFGFSHRLRAARAAQKILGNQQNHKHRDKSQYQRRTHPHAPNIAVDFLPDFSTKVLRQRRHGDHGGNVDAAKLALGGHNGPRLILRRATGAGCRHGRLRLLLAHGTHGFQCFASRFFVVRRGFQHPVKGLGCRCHVQAPLA